MDFVSWFFLNKILFAVMFDFFSNEFICPSYVIKMFREITVVLSPTIYASTIFIAETGGGAPFEFPKPTGACSRPPGGLQHVLYMQLLVQ